MGDADFRERQVLADLQRVAAPGAVPDPWVADFDPAAASGTRATVIAALLQLVLETGAPDPALDELWALHRQAVLGGPARSARP